MGCRQGRVAGEFSSESLKLTFHFNGFSGSKQMVGLLTSEANQFLVYNLFCNPMFMLCLL